jgi:hypothetical protein
MSNIIAFSGTHSTGKSTTVNDLKNQPDFYIDDFKVSRFVQQKLGYAKLEEAYKTPEKLIEFQMEILGQKADHDGELLDNPKLKHKTIIVERSLFDIAAYTNLWLKRVLASEYNAFLPTEYREELRKWSEAFSRKCLTMQSWLYGGVALFLINDDVAFVEDPNRADYYSRQWIQDEILMLSTTLIGPPVKMISHADRSYRVTQIKNFAKDLRYAK